MVGWIVLATVLVGLIVLALAVWSVWERLPELERALVRLQDRQEMRKARLQASLTALQDRMTTLQRQAEVAQQRVTLIQARAGRPAGPSAPRPPWLATVPEHGGTTGRTAPSSASSRG